MKRSTLPGGLGLRAELWRAFRGVLTPAEVDRSRLVELAVLLGLDEDDNGTGAPSVPHPVDGVPDLGVAGT